MEVIDVLFNSMRLRVAGFFKNQHLVVNYAIAISLKRIN